MKDCSSRSGAFRCIVFVFVIAAVSAIAFWCGYLSGQNAYKIHGITFIERADALTVSVGDYHMFFEPKLDSFILSKSVPGKEFPLPMFMETINHDEHGNPESMSTTLIDFPNQPLNNICNVTRNITSNKIEQIIFSHDPVQTTRPFAESTYIDENGDGTFDVWINMPEGDRTRGNIMRLQNSPPYIVSVVSTNPTTTVLEETNPNATNE